MELSDRQIDILSRINRDGRVDVDDLAGEFAVTTQTIRRDLNELCTRGLAARIPSNAQATEPKILVSLKEAI